MFRFIFALLFEKKQMMMMSHKELRPVKTRVPSIVKREIQRDDEKKKART